ncbi:MAG: pyrroline-5-carboxylate reductase [Armatimonadota bacterium]
MDSQYENECLGVIGAGFMGSAIVRGLEGHEALSAMKVILSDVNAELLTKVFTDLEAQGRDVQCADCNQQVLDQASVVLLAVKPQVLDNVLTPLKFKPGQLVISIAAGVPISRLEGLIGSEQPIVRVMPNVLAGVNQAASAYSPNAHVAPTHVQFVDELLSWLGTAVRVEEKLLDAVTGLSGSGPAFVALFAEALTDGGVVAGLPRADAAKLAAQTIRGVGEWLLQTGSSPAILKDMVTSPGGTTIAGVRALEAGGLRSAAIEAVVAAAQRSRELGS